MQQTTKSIFSSLIFLLQKHLQINLAQSSQSFTGTPGGLLLTLCAPGGGAYGPPVTLFTFSHSILTLMFPDQVLNKEFEVGFDIKPSLAGLDHFSALYGNLNDTNLQKKFHKK